VADTAGAGKVVVLTVGTLLASRQLQTPFSSAPQRHFTAPAAGVSAVSSSRVKTIGTCRWRITKYILVIGTALSAQVRVFVRIAAGGRHVKSHRMASRSNVFDARIAR
jgi:hypothetical protein